MRVLIITPSGPSSRTGNRVAAHRWAGILRQLGHATRTAESFDGQACDLLVAIHAWRSSASIARFKAQYPDRPVVLQLSGTDIYQYLEQDPVPTLAALDHADRLVALNRCAWRKVPKRLRSKLVTILQSAAPATAPRQPSVRSVDISVIGHLREVKDPLRAAAAARLLPTQSRIRILQAGAAYDQRWADLARQEQAGNQRYRWLGDQPAAAVRRLLLRSHAMAITSVNEGGANVVSEAIACGTPILASRMDGNVGLLGAAYPGYFPVGDSAALARLMWRLETEPRFAARLRAALATLAPQFRPGRETREWRRLLRDMGCA